MKYHETYTVKEILLIDKLGNIRVLAWSTVISNLVAEVPSEPMTNDRASKLLSLKEVISAFHLTRSHNISVETEFRRRCNRNIKTIAVQ